jgi:hypothetical protein
MGTKKPASPTAVVAAGRQYLRPPLPQRQGLVERYPRTSCESIIAAATAPTVTRCLMACRRMRTTLRVRENSRVRISPRRGERLPRFQETKCPTHCWSTQAPALRRPRLFHECTARLPGSPHSRRNGSAQTGFVDCCKISNWPLRATRLISAKLKGSDVALGPVWHP